MLFKVVIDQKSIIYALNNLFNLILINGHSLKYLWNRVYDFSLKTIRNSVFFPTLAIIIKHHLQILVEFHKRKIKDTWDNVF